MPPDGVVDVGFVLPETRPLPLRFVALSADPVVGACAPTHNLAGGGRVPLRALAGYRVALNRWGTGAAEFVAEFTAAGLPAAGLTDCCDALTALRLARDHDHVALAPESIAGEYFGSGELTPLDLRRSRDGTFLLPSPTGPGTTTRTRFPPFERRFASWRGAAPPAPRVRA
jgi:DNA-binding transcriptional LysR family regulator